MDLDIKILDEICKKGNYEKYKELSEDVKKFIYIVSLYAKEYNTGNTNIINRFLNYYDRYTKSIKPMKIPRTYNTLESLPKEDFVYYPKYIPLDTRLKFVEKIDSLFPLARAKNKLFGKEYTIPRDQMVMGSGGYDYSGVRVSIIPWNDITKYIKTYIEDIPQIKEKNIKFDLVLINGYNGLDKVDWHADDEKKLNKKMPIVSVSIGDMRYFDIRDLPDKKQKWRVPLYSGDVIIMMPGVQSKYQHRIPILKSAKRRYNLTFRVYK